MKGKFKCQQMSSVADVADKQRPRKTSLLAAASGNLLQLELVDISSVEIISDIYFSDSSFLKRYNTLSSDPQTEFSERVELTT